MGRGRIEIKKIENTTNRQVTFSKRRAGLMKKAKELSVLCDAQIGLIVFSTSGKLFEFSTDNSMPSVLDRYMKANGTRIEDYSNQVNIEVRDEVTRMRDQTDKLQASIRQFCGENLSSLDYNGLNQLEQQLENSVNKVRARKNLLLQQQLENLRRKEQIMEEEHSYLHHCMMEQKAAALEHHQAVSEQKTLDQPLLEQFGVYTDEQARNLLQLSPFTPQLHTFRLQLSQPNLQEADLYHPDLQLGLNGDGPGEDELGVSYKTRLRLNGGGAGEDEFRVSYTTHMN